jgi:HEAT repeat protein
MHDHKNIIDKLLPFARRADFDRVKQAVHALRQFGSETVVALAHVLGDSDENVRLIALEVLSEWEGDKEPALPAMIRALNDPDRIVRIAAVGPVAQHAAKAKDAIPFLRNWLDTDDEHSRLTAAALILRIDSSQDDKMLTILSEGTTSEDAAIRCLTAWLLSGIRAVIPQASRLLYRMLSDEDEFVRLVVADELASQRANL